MATRVNTRFVLILAVTLFTAVGIVGGLWVLQIRSDTTRHIKAGDALMVRAVAATDSGDPDAFDAGQALYEQALKQYGRAVIKEPEELSHLRKLEAALASLRPTTQNRAGELDAMRVEALRHEVRYRRQDPEAHMKLIRELYGLARQFNQTGAWQQVAEAADDMYNSVMSSDPMRDLALLYRGMGNMRAYGLAGIGPISSTATTDDIDAAELDLQNYVDEYEEDDLAWAALAESKLSDARRLRADNRTREADDADIQAREILAQALANVPDGPEVARVEAIRLALLSLEHRQAVARLMPAVARGESEVARLWPALALLKSEVARLESEVARLRSKGNGRASARAADRALSRVEADPATTEAELEAAEAELARLRSEGNGSPSARAADRALSRAEAELEAAEVELAPIEAQLEAAVDRLEQLVSASDDPLLLADVTEIIRTTDFQEGLPRSVDLIRAYVDAHADALYQRLQLAQLCYLARNHDPAYLSEAYEAADAVINAEPVPVSTLSKIQNPLRIRASGLIVDIEYHRWMRAEEADKADQLNAIVKAKDRLKTLVAEPEKDVTCIRAEGKIAAARNDFRVAVDRFERALELATTDDFETLWNAARCLVEIGQEGKAWERIERAHRLRPTNIGVLTEKARLEFKAGRAGDALASAQTVLAMDPENVPATRIVQAIAAQEFRGGRASELGGPAGLLVQAREKVEAGDFEEARRILVNAMEEAEDKLPFLSELIGVEMRAGRREEAMVYLDQALELEPNNQFLRKHKIRLSAENPVEAEKQFVEAAYESEADRAVHSVIQLRQLARRLDNTAESQTALGDLETAEQTSAQADEAREEAEQFLARATELAPDHTSLIDHLFNEELLQLQELADKLNAIARRPAAPEDDETRARLDAAREEAEQALVELAERARVVDADQVGGLIYRGRLEIYQGDYERAVRTLTDATIRKSWSALAWRLLGRAHERMGNFSDALRAYEEAYTCNPNDQFAVRSYITLLVRSGDQTRALQILRSVQRSVSADDELRDLWMQLEASVGNLAVAIDERRTRYERSGDLRKPEDRLNAMRLVALLERAKPSYELVTQDGQRKYSANQWALLSDDDRQEELDIVAGRMREYSSEIIAALNKATGGASLEVAWLQAGSRRARGEVDEGEEVLRAFFESHRDDRAMSLLALIRLGQYQASVNRFGAAADTYQAAREFQSEDRREADRALADLWFSRSRWEQAEKLYSDLAGPEAGREVLLRLAECYLKLKRFEEATAALERTVALTDGGQDFFTAMLSAGIADGHGDQLLALGRRDEADQEYALGSAALDEAERLRPNSPLPHVRRAQRLADKFELTERMTLLDDAMLHLDRAERAAAGDESVSRVRVEIYLRKGDVRGAVGELIRLLERTPGKVDARKLLVDIYAESRNWDRALALIDEAITRNPTNPLWNEARGDLLVLMSRAAVDPKERARLLAESVPAFRTAFDLQPSGPRLAKYAETALAGEAPAYVAVAEAVSAREELVEGRPLLRSLYARALDRVGRYDEALEQMRAAYRKHRELMEKQRSENGHASPAGLVNWLWSLQTVMSDRDPAEYEQFVTELAGGRLDSVEQLYVARVWVTSGPEGLSRAIELVHMALAQCPADDTALRAQLELDLGQFEVVADNIPAAVQAFERALEIDPVSVLALNNAAYIYAEHLNDLDKALDYAQRAVEVSPNEGTVLDTLGWTLYRLGRYAEAEGYLSRSTEARRTPDNHLHLARVLFETTKDLEGQAATDRLHRTRTYLNRAAELQPSEELQMEIDRLAEEIEAWAKSAGQRLRR